MHDVFVAVLRAEDRLRDDAPAGLLLRVATNVCLNRLRALRRRPEDGDDALLSRIADHGGRAARRGPPRATCWQGCLAPTIPWRRRPPRWRSCTSATD